MAKESGLGAALWVGGYRVSNDIQAVPRIAGGNSPLDVTGIDKNAYERIGGVRGGGMDLSAFFNPDVAPGAHGVFAALPTTDVIGTFTVAAGIGRPAASLVAKQLGYDANRGQDGSLTFAISMDANGYGLEWGELLTAGERSDTAATNGASLDGAAATTFGAQAWLHVLSFTGTSCTVTLEDSADNVSFTPITGGAFTAATGVTSQRIETARGLTVRRYVRAVTSGTFTQCTFVVQFTRNQTTVVF